MGNAPPVTAAEPIQVPSQEKMNEYIKIGEQGTTISSWIERLLRDGKEVLRKFTLLYQDIIQASKELQAVAGSLFEELDNARLQRETLRTMVNCSADDLVNVGIINHPRAHKKALTALDYRVDQIEYIMERIDKAKDEALEARYNMEDTIAKMAPGMLSES
ncbi:hypothetical protein KI387_030174, partial [Taxus chinensis]